MIVVVLGGATTGGVGGGAGADGATIVVCQLVFAFDAKMLLPGGLAPRREVKLSDVAGLLLGAGGDNASDFEDG
jgi:hypothetical protein